MLRGFPVTPPSPQSPVRPRPACHTAAFTLSPNANHHFTHWAWITLLRVSEPCAGLAGQGVTVVGSSASWPKLVWQVHARDVFVTLRN